MNNFPAITEAQRQQLIESCQLEIKQNPHSPHAQMAKIALATLTAEPVAYTDDEELEDLSKHTFANMFTPRKEYKTDPLWMPLFTAPPAPVLCSPAYHDEAKRLAELHGMSFVVFRHGEAPAVADPTRVIIGFTDKGLGHDTTGGKK